MSCCECDDGTRCANCGEHLTPTEQTIPAPTWRPIAELPERHPEWLDGRRVIVETAHGLQFLARHNAASGWYHKWHTDDDVYITDPARYLDLAIPEVPR